MIDIAMLKEKILSSKIEESVQGIDQAIKIFDEIGDVFIEAIKTSSDPLITTERISLFFSDFLSKLRKAMDSDDLEMRFWVATLIIHYNILDSQAEKILLDAVRLGPFDKATTATTILCRIKNKNVADAISERLKKSPLSDKVRRYFIEKLNDLRE